AMGTISLRGLKLPKIESPVLPAPPRTRKRPPRFWVAVGIGVLLLVGLAVGSYLIFTVAFQRTQGPDGDTPPSNAEGPGDRLPDPDRPLPVIGVLHEPETDTPPAKGVNPKNDERYGMTSLRVPLFVAAQPRLMPILPLRTLDQPAASQELLD